MKRKFRITVSGEFVIELDQEVIDAVDDEWRSQLYRLETPEEIAEHLGYNLVINRARLTQLDGWADKEDIMAEVLEIDWSDWNTEEIAL